MTRWTTFLILKTTTCLYFVYQDKEVANPSVTLYLSAAGVFPHDLRKNLIKGKLLLCFIVVKN